MEGNLLKWTNYISGWQERFFVLKGPLFYYYYNKNDKPRCKIHLGISTIIEDENCPFFQINTGSNIFFMKAQTETEQSNWIKAIKVGKLEGEKQIRQLNQNQSSNSLTLIKDNLDKLKQQNEEIQKVINNLNTNQIEDINLKLNEIYCANNEMINNLKEQLLPQEEDNNNDFKSRGLNLFRQNNNDDNDKLIPNTYALDDEMFYDCDEYSDNDELDDDFTHKKNNPNLLQSQNQKQPLSLNNNPSSLLINNNNPLLLIKPTTEFNDPLYNYKRRTSLPTARKELSVNVWKFFKSAVGKDVNRFAVPVFFNEPLSMLQKLCENFQYAYLLNNAAFEPNPYMRIAYCAAFCIGGFVMNTHRTTKYFNPILFETYEYIDNEQNFRYFGEQVSHHPAISACYAEGKGWTFYTNGNAGLKFLITGKLEITNSARCFVSFSNFKDNIVFSKPLCVVRNLILGTIELDMDGKFNVSNDKGDSCEVEMIPSTSGQKGGVVGQVKDVYGNVMLRIEGNWLDSIYVVNPTNKEDKKMIWKIIPSTGYENYFFQPYSFDLNYLTNEMKDALPRTDSRFRPDQKLMELQDIDEAGEEKHRLEEKQRKARKDNASKGIIPKPMYFDETYDDLTGELVYKYKGGYFEDRKNKNFGHFPDIF